MMFTWRANYEPEAVLPLLVVKLTWIPLGVSTTKSELSAGSDSASIDSVAKERSSSDECHAPKPLASAVEPLLMRTWLLVKSLGSALFGPALFSNEYRASRPSKLLWSWSWNC